MKNNKTVDMTPQLMLSAYNTLIQGCRSIENTEDGACNDCILYDHCPSISDDIPANWKELHYPYLEGNTVIYIKDNKVQRTTFSRREEAEIGLKELGQRGDT